MSKYGDLTGQRFFRWTVIGPKKFTRKSGEVESGWLCRCDCGNQSIVPPTRLSFGLSRSCGCLQKEVAAKLKASHRKCGTKAYRSWVKIKQRCLNPKNKGFKRYGGAGITIADEWRDNFQAFYDHIGPAPSDSHSVDRIDNSRGYEPGNVRWATASEQARNRSDNTWVNISGRKLCLKDAAKSAGLNHVTVRGRLRRGWDLKTALSEPAKRAGYSNKVKRQRKVEPSIVRREN